MTCGELEKSEASKVDPEFPTLEEAGPMITDCWTCCAGELACAICHWTGIGRPVPRLIARTFLYTPGKSENFPHPRRNAHKRRNDRQSSPPHRAGFPVFRQCRSRGRCCLIKTRHSNRTSRTMARIEVLRCPSFLHHVNHQHDKQKARCDHQVRRGDTCQEPEQMPPRHSQSIRRRGTTADGSPCHPASAERGEAYY